MSYCVNCGVELAKSEQNCPLCGTEVVNPLDPWKEPKAHPYPAYFETVVRGVDRRYFAFLMALVLMIPVLICILIDVFAIPSTGWSLYVAGAVLLLMTVVLVPVIARVQRPVLFLMLDLLVLAAYLYLIDSRAIGESWFMSLALPLVLAVGLAILAVIVYYQLRKKRGILISFAVFLFAIGGLNVMINIIINAYLDINPPLEWAWYVLIPSLLLGFAALLIDKQRKWKEKVKKRLFF